VDPDLWEFCGAEDTRLSEVPGRQEHPGSATGAVCRPGSDHGATFGVVASSCRGHTCRPGPLARARRPTARHARHLDEQQPGHRAPVLPAHPGRRYSRPIPLTTASTRNPAPFPRLRHPQRPVTTSAMSRTDSRRLPADSVFTGGTKDDCGHANRSTLYGWSSARCGSAARSALSAVKHQQDSQLHTVRSAPSAPAGR